MGATLRIGDDLQVDLGAVLAKAGEGTIYEIAGRPEWVAKIFHPDPVRGATKRDKVAAMIQSPPSGAVQADGFVVLTWPLRLIDQDGALGYLMPRIDTRDAVEIHTVSNPSNRMNPLPSAPQWTPHTTWMHLVNVAANLCLAVDTVHHVDAVIGDFQERNILVSDTTRVTLVDCDSMQFTDRDGRRFLCPVGRPEFTAPELAGQDLAVVAREQPSDLFALAVHIHLLLMAGNHPFLRGTWTGDGEQPDALTLARSGEWAGGPGSRLLSHPLAPPPSFLPAEVRELFVRALTEGAHNPARRPSAAEWRHALQQIRTVDCPRGHQVPMGTEVCPWCAIDDERARRKAQRAQQDTTQQVIYRAPSPAPAPQYFGSPQQQPQFGSPQQPVGEARSMNPMAIVGIIAAIAAVIIGIIVAVSMSGSDSTSAYEGGSRHRSSDVTDSSTYTSTITTAATATVPPPGAVECGGAIAGAYAHAAIGSTITSCPFALKVLNAVNGSNRVFPQMLQVFSPVTKQQYAMMCAVEQVLTCRGGNNAVVYVY